jgi:hypothetical protein
MDRTHIFLVSGKRGALRVATGPFDFAAAARRAAEMRLQGFQSITLIDVDTGDQVDIDGFKPGKTPH